MAAVRLSDIIEPEAFTNYVVQNSLERTALVQSGILAKNAVIQTQLNAGADSFNVPIWLDLGNEEANITNDDPDHLAIPHKLGTTRQLVRKAFLHNSWSAMNLASEISGSDALTRIQGRVTAYWDRQLQRRLISTLNAVLADNIANHASDMVMDISANTGGAESFGAAAVIDTAETLGDWLNTVTAIAMHSKIYSKALKNDLIETRPDSQGGQIQTFRGLQVIVDNGLPNSGGDFTTVLFGAGVIGYGLAAPRVAQGTEVENRPGAGNGGGQQILHSRINTAIQPHGYSWVETAVAGESPTIAELGNPANWSRTAERAGIPLAFLISKI